VGARTRTAAAGATRRRARRKTAPPRRAYHHGDLRRALVDASLALLAEHGPQGLTLREAARRAGVSQAAPYRHFASKDALLAAIAEEGFRGLQKATAAAAARGHDPLERLIDACVAYVRFAVEHMAHYRVMFGPAVLDKSMYPGLRTSATGSFDALTNAIAECQRRGVLRAGDPRPMAMATWTLVHGLAALAADRQIPPAVLTMIPLERLADGLMRMLLQGLAPPKT
jgi:AcrR family transcriptional regulator